MRKLAKLFLILSLVAVLASSLCVMASAATDTVSTFNQLYIGDYDQGSDKYTGMAHVVFGTVSNTDTEFGVLIETEEGKTFKFPGRAIADSGKFGVAIYQLPEGNYKAYAYSGTDDNRIVGDAAYFTANKATFTLTFDTSKTAGVTAPSSQTVAQGTPADKPTVSIPASAPANSDVAWVTADGKALDFNSALTGDTVAYSKWCATESAIKSTYTYTQPGDATTGRTYLASATGVDLTDGSSMTMEFDITKSFSASSNINIYFNAFAWLPASNNTGLGGVAYMGVGYNPAYGATAAQWQGWLDVTGGYSAPGSTTASANNVGKLLSAGYTIKYVYTAPTADTVGSMYIYRKTTGADDSTYTEIGNLLNIPYAPFAEDFAQTGVNLGFGMYDVNTASYSGSFTNVKIYGEDGICLPITITGFTDRYTVEKPSCTVTYMKDGSTYAQDTIEVGSTTTAPDISSLTAPLGGEYVWVDVNGNEFDFDTEITKNTTVYLKAIADPTIRENEYKVNVTSSTSPVNLMTSVGMDLSSGDTLYLELDVLSSDIRDWHNCYVGFTFWQYLPSYGSSISGNQDLTGFHDTTYVNNPIHWYQGNTGSYKGSYSHGDHSGANPTLSGEFNPATLFATGKTVRMAYTAPTDTTNGSIMLYNKDIGADDSTYTLISSVTDLVKASAVTNTSTYAGLVMYTSQSGISFTFTNWHAYTESYGDIPAMFDYKNAGEISQIVPEYTVTYNVDTTYGMKGSIPAQTVEQGDTILAPDTSALTMSTHAYATVIYLDEDNNQVTFPFTPTKDTVLTAYTVGDTALKDKVWSLQDYTGTNLGQGGNRGHFGAMVPVNLSDGSAVVMEYDIVEANVPNANYNIMVDIRRNATHGKDSGNYVFSPYLNAALASPYMGTTYSSLNATGVERNGAGLKPSAVFATGKSVKLVYTAPTTDTVGSFIIYNKNISDPESAYVAQYSWTNISYNNVKANTSVVLSFDFSDYGHNTVMKFTNWHTYTTKNGLDIPGGIGTCSAVSLVDVTADTNTYNVTTPSAGATAGFGGEKAQTIAYGNSLVYDFKVVESNLGEQDVLGDGAGSADNATEGYIGFAVENGSSVSNWPGNMICTNGSYSGIPAAGFGGVTAEKGAGCAHWYQLLQTGANVKVVYTRTSSASANDGSFIIYRKLAGETEYSVFVAYRGLADISGSGRINIMYENKYGARVLKLTDLATYVLDTNGNKVSIAGALGTANLTFTAE